MPKLILFITFFLIVISLQAQDIAQDKIRIAFYNVENLFDVVNDSLKNDDEFTPEGAKEWTYGRYKKKLSNTYRVIIALGGWEPLGIIGLCEIENYKVLTDLITKTPLEKLKYQIIHKESPDQRGIDVALLYRREAFRPIHYEPIAVDGGPTDDWVSREILYVKGVVFGTDTVHLFVNHWPSRSGGQARSDPRRRYAATLLKAYTDSLFRHEKNPKVIIMGDFNDNPDDRSLQILTKDDELINLMNPLYKKGRGTIAHTNTFLQWFMFDQIIVSESIVNSTDSVSVGEVGILDVDWLKDEKSGRPFRTYQGPVYLGGFSDHFPVYFDLIKK